MATVLPRHPARESSLQGSVIQIIRNPPLTAELTAQLVDLWAAVTNVGGGAVGFARGVTPEQVRALADPAFDRVRGGVDDLVIAFVDDQPVGMAFLATNELALHAHWGTVKRLQRHPDVRESGVGTVLLAGVEDAARDRGLERLVLTVRAGTGREGFYAARGYRMEAVLPGRIRIEGGEMRDELLMAKDLSGAGGAALRVQRLDRDLPLPAYAHPGDAGLDLYAATDVTLEPGERAVIGTGIAVALPVGCVGLIHPKSGLAARAGLGLVNAPGTIDAGYRGEVKVIAINLDPASSLHLGRGERIAQLVIQRVETVAVTEVDTLDDTARGAGGFGSSGR